MNQFKIWYLSSEVAPFAKTGGLGDVTGSFPKSIKTHNHEIRVIMPKYKTINERKYVLREVIRLKNIPVTINDITKTINVKSAFLPDSKVQIYFIEIPEFFGRSGLYTDTNSRKDYNDNAERFAYFCKGALETLKILSWRPDIIHCNDWQTALIPVYLKTIYKDDEFLRNIKTVFTIHNFAYQGIFERKIAPSLDINSNLIENDAELVHQGNLNLLKGAIHFSDWITTVSPTYAEQIRSDIKLGQGLETFLQANSKKFSGFLNGVDYSVWSPEKDKYIPFKYSVEDISGKEQNKQALLTRVNLKYQENIPVIGIISRIVEHKGFDILLEVVPELINLNLQIVILGTGNKKIEKQLQSLQKKYPRNISLHNAFDETLAHMIEAGADIFLRPSQYEAYGLNQIYSLKYGTIPIVFKTGGLADTITEIDIEAGTGNGFLFEKYTSKELLKAVKRCLRVYKKKELWQDLRLSVMQKNYEWDASAEKYLEVYSNILADDGINANFL
jgi:starch synthase